MDYNPFDLIKNSLNLARAAIAARAGQMYDGKRDTWKILGYKPTLIFEDFLAMYERQDVAGRIVDMPAQETWRRPPKIIPKQGDASSDFTKGVSEFAERIKLWHYLEKADRLSGIGRYGALLIGVADSGDLDVPINSVESLDDIMYLAAYHEKRAEVTSVITDHTNPRFGLPEFYKIKLIEFTDADGNLRGRVGISDSAQSAKVHHSRIIHICDDPLYDDVYGRPRLQRVFNRMFDLLKIAGGSSEMFWQNVAQIFHINLDPELEYQPEDLKALDDKFAEMLAGIRRVVQTEGIEEIKTLQGETPDPRGVFAVLRALIASGAEIPQRILFGSEQGEQASTQDQSEWYGRIEYRRSKQTEPLIIRPFFDRLASWGCLTIPEGGYTAQWPSLFQQTPVEQANTGRALAMAASKLNPTNPSEVITVEEVREASGLPREKRKDDTVLTQPEPVVEPTQPPGQGAPDGQGVVQQQ